MFKLILLNTLLLSFSSFASITVSCIGENPEISGNISISGPYEKSFSTEMCVKWDMSTSCKIPYYDDDDFDECPCVKVEQKTYYYHSWKATGLLKSPRIKAKLNFEFDKYSDNKRFSGTQSGKVGKYQYVANFWSNQGYNIPGEAITIMFTSHLKGAQYTDTARERLRCDW